ASGNDRSLFLTSVGHGVTGEVLDWTDHSPALRPIVRPELLQNVEPLGGVDDALRSRRRDAVVVAHGERGRLGKGQPLRTEAHRVGSVGNLLRNNGDVLR